MVSSILLSETGQDTFFHVNYIIIIVGKQKKNRDMRKKKSSSIRVIKYSSYIYILVAYILMKSLRESDFVSH